MASRIVIKGREAFSTGFTRVERERQRLPRDEHGRVSHWRTGSGRCAHFCARCLRREPADDHAPDLKGEDDERCTDGRW